MPALQGLTLAGIVVALFEVLGVLTAAHALLRARSPQGSIAWALVLVFFPFVSLPLYWIFARNKFHGYVSARRAGDAEIHHIVEHLAEREDSFRARLLESLGEIQALERLAKTPFTHSNRIELLVDGQATFDAIFEGIEAAEDYILVQFFIVKDDRVGRDLKDRLVRRASEGIRVYFLYDEIGSYKLSRAYIHELREAGVDIRPFHTTKGRWNRFQINFRNHRKIVVIDGKTAYVGGHNVGDEYLGRHEKFGHWRDTHVKITGPAVPSVQLAFLEDWHWATPEIPKLNWVPEAADGADQHLLVLPTGPADDLDTCALFFVHAIHSARRRIWISSPYFVPDDRVMAALQLAVLRGVDVRVMLPEHPDHMLVYLASFSYYEETIPHGVKILRYGAGFLHQKAMLVDNGFAAVGTANMDPRSFRLHFEITIAAAEPHFAEAVEEMFARDFANCRQATMEDLSRRSLPFRVAVRIARLFEPVL